MLLGGKTYAFTTQKHRYCFHVNFFRMSLCPCRIKTQVSVVLEFRVYEWLDILLAEADDQLDDGKETYELHQPWQPNELSFQPVVVLPAYAVELQTQCGEQHP